MVSEYTRSTIRGGLSLKKWLPAFILIMSLLYIFLIPNEPLSVKITFKIIPMLLMILYAYKLKQAFSKYQVLILVGLFFCMLGDGLLIWFIVGLSAFLIGHLFYIAAFLQRFTFSWLRALTILPIAVYSLIIGTQVVQALNQNDQSNLVIPVICYILVISIMGWTAIMTGNRSAVVGGLLFVASDSILSWNMFVSEVAYSHPLIMLTYYGGQFFIANSISTRLAVVKNPIQKGLTP
ncbi:lysoplasmalogenase [Peribacillus psychrosaccharolyticus]|uniref:Lysoplasmalogenase n=1 Tax=Peribacillus psychrosaccharolyticus TaxID=1407 RepID=A0A974RYX7_PERPY|nr:lysoplasmalogenase [Peribacillus psychrosaccharolyticus]